MGCEWEEHVVVYAQSGQMIGFEGKLGAPSSVTLVNIIPILIRKGIKKNKKYQNT